MLMRKNNSKPKDTHGFYDSRKWHKVALYIRQKYYYMCQNKHCNNKGTYVHHIDPLTEDDYINKPAEKCYGEENLTLLCFDCHEIIHNRKNTGIREGCYFDENGSLQIKE